MKTFSILSILFLLVGCSSKPTLPSSEYITVEVPVVYKINRPPRPLLTEDKSIPGYLNEILNYTRLLEVIIDNHNITK